MAYYIEEIKQYWVYDPEGAERLLDEAGYPRGADGVRFRTEILARVPVTLELGAAALLIGLVIALPVGIYSAVRQGTLGDYVGRSVAIFGLATPNFWLGLMILIFPGSWWGWAPPIRLFAFSAWCNGHRH